MSIRLALNKAHRGASALALVAVFGATALAPARVADAALLVADLPGLPPGLPLQVTTDHAGVQRLAIGSDMVVYHAVRSSSSSIWSPFQPVDGVDPGPMKAYRVSIDTNEEIGQAQLLAIGLDHRVWHRIRYDDGSSTQWGLTGPSFQAVDVAITIGAHNEAHVAAVGTDNTVWHRVRHSNGTWTWWAFPSGYNGSQALKATRVAVAFERTGEHPDDLTLATIGTDGRIYLATRRPNGAWAPVLQLAALPGGAQPVDISISYVPTLGHRGVQAVGVLDVTAGNGNVYRSRRIDGVWDVFTQVGPP